jgi:hypothetical protein
MRVNFLIAQKGRSKIGAPSQTFAFLIHYSICQLFSAKIQVAHLDLSLHLRQTLWACTLRPVYSMTISRAMVIGLSNAQAMRRKAAEP